MTQELLPGEAAKFAVEWHINRAIKLGIHSSGDNLHCRRVRAKSAPHPEDTQCCFGVLKVLCPFASVYILLVLSHWSCASTLTHLDF